ncbi:type I-E CRISPR-associated protein Cas7/Cse4/CasC [Streptacidiphilus sp. MAP5-3]|uniref:type I-E CRISPR-associated protein Cas7/Cse4/CasC n=1 Tax=unclassified Streptacidiphilus TaxID=2643834 RepID=UPI003515C767
MSLYLDLSVIQSYPLSCLNRDDLNTPKSATFGGVTRGRVSSQSTKRHNRVAVESRLGEQAIRTRRLPEVVSAELQRRIPDAGWTDRAGRMIVLACGVDGVKIEAKTNDTNSMLLVPKSAVGALADLAVEHRALIEVATTAAEEKKAQEKLNKAAGQAVLEILRGRTSSIAAFGRMLANEPGSLVDGAIQVAHQVTTHATAVQSDFFTAVDDITHGQQDESGSAHMGTVQLTSGTFYRFASVNLPELTRNLDQDAEAAQQLAVQFARAFATTTPTARKNGTAPFTAPALVYAVLRTDTPVNLCDAFEKPVTAPNGSGWLEPSITAFDRHVEATNAFYGTEPIAFAAHTNITTVETDHLGERTEGLGGLTSRLTDSLAKATI